MNDNTQQRYEKSKTNEDIKDQKIQILQRKLEVSQKRNQHLLSKKNDVELKLRSVTNSRLYKILKGYYRFKSEFLKGNKHQRRKFLSDVLTLLYRLRNKTRTNKQDQQLEKQLDQFLEHVKSSSTDSIVFMFSGTTYIQDYKGNRPIRITKELLNKKVPVIFSYWRWNTNDSLPEYTDVNLFQSPIDYTMKVMKKLSDFDFKGKKKIFIISFPHESCARWGNVFKMNGWTTIYDVRDEWEEFHKVGQAKWFNQSIEKYIVNNVDVVCTVSRPLQEKMQSFTENKKVYLSPNGLGEEYLENGKITIPEKVKTKTIGYVGHLTDAWFDWESLINIAQSEPSWNFELIGHTMPSTLNLPSNIKHLGPKKYNEIKEISKTWNVAIIPFKISKLADGVDPIKVYEYLAMGLPVVSFRMPQIHDYPYVFIANSTDEFKENIKKAFDVQIDKEVVHNFLMVNRWVDRANQFLSWGQEYHSKGVLNSIKQGGEVQK